MKFQRLLRLPEVKQLTGLSRSTIYNLASRGSFPKPVALSERAVAWIQSEIESWIDDRILESRKQHVHVKPAEVED